MTVIAVGRFCGMFGKYAQKVFIDTNRSNSRVVNGLALHTSYQNEIKSRVSVLDTRLLCSKQRNIAAYRMVLFTYIL